MKENQRELKIRMVNEKQFEAVLMEKEGVRMRSRLTFNEVNALIWAFCDRIVYDCKDRKSVCSTISVEF